MLLLESLNIFDNFVTPDRQAAAWKKYGDVSKDRQKQLQVLHDAGHQDKVAADYLFETYLKQITSSFWYAWCGPDKRFWRQRIINKEDQEFLSTAYVMLLGENDPDPFKSFDASFYDDQTNIINNFGYWYKRYLDNEGFKHFKQQLRAAGLKAYGRGETTNGALNKVGVRSVTTDMAANQYTDKKFDSSIEKDLGIASGDDFSGFSDGYKDSDYETGSFDPDRDSRGGVMSWDTLEGTGHEPSNDQEEANSIVEMGFEDFKEKLKKTNALYYQVLMMRMDLKSQNMSEKDINEKIATELNKSPLWIRNISAKLKDLLTEYFS